MAAPPWANRGNWASHPGEARKREEDGEGDPLVLWACGLAGIRGIRGGARTTLPGVPARPSAGTAVRRRWRARSHTSRRARDTIAFLEQVVGGAIDLDDETLACFADYWCAVAPDGPEHFTAVAAKLDRMHREEPSLTVADLAGYPRPVSVMVGDRDEERTRSSPRAHRPTCRQSAPP